MRMRRRDFLGATDGELARHSQMNQQMARFAIRARRIQRQQQKLSPPLHVTEHCARKLLRQFFRLLDEIRFAEPDFDNPPAGQTFAQPAHHCFDFGKLRHNASQT